MCKIEVEQASSSSLIVLWNYTRLLVTAILAFDIAQIPLSLLRCVNLLSPRQPLQLYSVGAVYSSDHTFQLHFFQNQAKYGT